MAELYVSTDIEADGPVPGVYSMLSLGSVAYRADGTSVGEFAVNLEVLPEARVHPETERWWQSQPEAWAACRLSLECPSVALPRYAEWIESLPGAAIFVAYPLGFDFSFVSWYLHRFTGRCPFGYSGIDVKSFAMALLRADYQRSTRRFMPLRWFGELEPNHVALDDARAQGTLFLRMLAESRQNGEAKR